MATGLTCTASGPFPVASAVPMGRSTASAAAGTGGLRVSTQVPAHGAAACTTTSTARTGSATTTRPTGSPSGASRTDGLQAVLTICLFDYFREAAKIFGNEDQ